MYREYSIGMDKGWEKFRIVVVEKFRFPWLKKISLLGIYYWYICYCICNKIKGILQNEFSARKAEGFSANKRIAEDSGNA